MYHDIFQTVRDTVYSFSLQKLNVLDGTETHSLITSHTIPHYCTPQDKNDKNEDDALAALTAMAAGGKKRGRLVSLEEQGAMSLMSLMEVGVLCPVVLPLS